MAGFFPVFFKQYWSAGTEAARQHLPPGPRERHRQPADRAARTATRRDRRPRRRARAHAVALHRDRRRDDRGALLGRAGRLDHGGARLLDGGLRLRRRRHIQRCAAGRRDASPRVRPRLRLRLFARLCRRRPAAAAECRDGHAPRSSGSRTRARPCASPSRWSPSGGCCSPCRRSCGCASACRRERCRSAAARRRLARTALDDRATSARYRPLLWFLLAYWMYIDGVNTIIKMAVDYGLSLGFPQQSLIAALLITQFVGFPGRARLRLARGSRSARATASSSRSPSMQSRPSLPTGCRR